MYKDIFLAFTPQPDVKTLYSPDRIPSDLNGGSKRRVLFFHRRKERKYFFTPSWNRTYPVKSDTIPVRYEVLSNYKLSINQFDCFFMFITSELLTGEPILMFFFI